jgi:glycosyltransferase involved in cell wall biosynthesis
MEVSIITVTFNSAETLRNTIHSVLNQTYQDIEYWIIDRGSTDSTIDIIKSFINRFCGKLHYTSENDHGIYDAMNKGINMATGDIIGILNSDDFFTSNSVIERLVSEFDDDIEAIYGDVHFVKNENLKKCVRYYSGKIFHPWMVKYGFIAPHSSFYIKKSTYEKYGLYSPSYKISADYELIVRLCYKYKIKTKYINVDSQTELAHYLSIADIFVCNSKEDTMPNVCLEALLCGTPILCYNISGMPYLAPSPMGSYVKDLDEMKNKITATLKKSEDVMNCCISFAQKEYGYQNVFSKLLKIYEVS